MKIAIIGAGITGLTAGYELSKAGHKVTIFEKNSYTGGLAAGIKEAKVLSEPPSGGLMEGLAPMVRQRRIISGWDLDKFQHHLFTNDIEAIRLIKELNLGNKLLKLSPKTAILYNNKIYRFDTPLSLLKFPHLSVLKKSKLATTIAYLKLTNDWKNLEKETADLWWKRKVGEKPYKMLWEPLLRGKFGDNYKNINMAWFWARIKKRTQKLYYLEGSFQVLIDKLVKEIKRRGGEICLNTETRLIQVQSASASWRSKVQNYSSKFKVEESRIEAENDFDKVIITASPQTLLQLLPNLPTNYKGKIQKLKTIGAQALILFLDKSFLTDGTYWLNINDPSYPFLSVVEHTNFIDPKHYDNNHIVYIGNYLDSGNPYFKMNNAELFKKFTPYLKKINSSFGNLKIRHCFLVRESFAQPIVGINHSKNIPSLQTPLENIHFASMGQVYPWDRGVNYAVEMGRRVAREIFNN